jgi:Dienelactone hydrolase and related enzymes
MKKILFLVFIIITSSAVKAQFNPAGIWEGKLNIGVPIRVVFHINKSDDNSYKATMDSPDQGVKGIPCSNVIVKNDSLIIESKALSGTYSGKFLNQNTLNGVFLQRGISFPLELKHVTEVSKLNRPQTPQPPFGYNIDSVEYDNADKTVHLGATLTYPKTKGPFPVAVLITGSGQQDRDETLFEHKPFAVIADYLTSRGIAVLRVDDRMRGKSKGDVVNATSLDFTNDVLTSIHYLLTRKEIDKNKIGVIGHSEGGLIAPIVYTKFPKLAFIISLAGSGVSGNEILLLQQTEPVKKIMNAAPFNAFYSLTQQTLHTIHDYAKENDSIIIKRIKKVFADWKASYPDSVLIPLNSKFATPEMYAKSPKIVLELTPWFKYFIATEPGEFWSEVKCPVLLLNGEKDDQVYAIQNTGAIQNALAKANNKKVTVKILPGLNHLFQHCKKCTDDEYGELEETFSPEVLELMNNWLQKNIIK